MHTDFPTGTKETKEGKSETRLVTCRGREERGQKGVGRIEQVSWDEEGMTLLSIFFIRL